MKIKSLIKLSKGFVDKRGKIIPICDKIMKSASLITTKKNQWRANHYHKTDWHYCYVIYGKINYQYIGILGELKHLFTMEIMNIIKKTLRNLI